jgi:hypothetical protein
MKVEYSNKIANLHRRRQQRLPKIKFSRGQENKRRLNNAGRRNLAGRKTLTLGKRRGTRRLKLGKKLN